MISESTVLSIGFISILAYLPLMVYLDLKDRAVPWEYFLSLAIINVPVTALMYYAGWMPWTHLVTSLMICLFAFAVWKVFGAGAFSAADRNLICCIALFFYWNPFNPFMDVNYAGFIALMYQLKFLVYFVMVLCLMPACIFALNLGIGNHRDSYEVFLPNHVSVTRYPQVPYTIWEMLTRVPGGIPMIVPIAAAFLLAAVWGV
jgi:hypothetical protein